MSIVGVRIFWSEGSLIADRLIRRVNSDRSSVVSARPTFFVEEKIKLKRLKNKKGSNIRLRVNEIFFLINRHEQMMIEVIEMKIIELGV